MTPPHPEAQVPERLALHVDWGQRIRVARADAQLTQEELARRTNIAQPTLSAWERGYGAPNDVTKFRLADALGRTIADLFPWPVEATADNNGEAA